MKIAGVKTQTYFRKLSVLHFWSQSKALWNHMKTNVTDTVDISK